MRDHRSHRFLFEKKNVGGIFAYQMAMVETIHRLLKSILYFSFYSTRVGSSKLKYTKRDVKSTTYFLKMF